MHSKLCIIEEPHHNGSGNLRSVFLHTKARDIYRFSENSDDEKITHHGVITNRSVDLVKFLKDCLSGEIYCAEILFSPIERFLHIDDRFKEHVWTKRSSIINKRGLYSNLCSDIFTGQPSDLWNPSSFIKLHQALGLYDTGFYHTSLDTLNEEAYKFVNSLHSIETLRNEYAVLCDMIMHQTKDANFLTSKTSMYDVESILNEFY